MRATLNDYKLASLNSVVATISSNRERQDAIRLAVNHQSGHVDSSQILAEIG